MIEERYGKLVLVEEACTKLKKKYCRCKASQCVTVYVYVCGEEGECCHNLAIATAKQNPSVVMIIIAGLSEKYYKEREGSEVQDTVGTLRTQKQTSYCVVFFMKHERS